MPALCAAGPTCSAWPQQPGQDFLQGDLQRAAGTLGRLRQRGLSGPCFYMQMLKQAGQASSGPNWLKDGNVKMSQPK